MYIKATLNTLLAAAAVAGVSAQDRATGKNGDALVVNDNPAGAVYVAKLPETAFTKGSAYANGGNVEGYVHATSGANGTGVVFKVKFSNLPKEGGPFKYHLHAAPVPEDGNCTATLAHLDPFIRGETPSCDKQAPETCEVGDLSGKYGEIKSDQDPFEFTFTDKYASLKEGIGAFFGNRSFVFHYANKTRISCANFKKVDGTGNGGGNGGDDGDCTTSGTATSTSAYPTGTSGSITKGPSGTGGVTPPRPSGSVVTAGAALVTVPRTMMAAGAASMFAAIMFML